eukprot:8466345-Pyramimonas_sp.AAC.1
MIARARGARDPSRGRRSTCRSRRGGGGPRAAADANYELQPQAGHSDDIYAQRVRAREEAEAGAAI